MNINRHNYETFFLLYVDKELSAADSKAVEVFAQQNPDLQIELELLQGTVMPADEVVLHKKDWLYMEEDISALQENLLLYTDGELDVTDQQSVKALLDTNMAAKAEWAVLQQTKLQPDMTVVFPGKQSLYKKEAGRVIGVMWWRVAAAAVLLGLGIWTGISVYNSRFQKTPDNGDLADQNKTQIKKQSPVTITDDTLQTASGTDNTVAENNHTNSAIQQPGTNQNENVANTSDKVSFGKAPNQPAANQNTTLQTNKKEDNNLPKPYFENINNKSGNETVTSNVQSENNNTRISGNNEAVVKINPVENNAAVIDINTGKMNTNSTALQAVNNNAADNGENNNSYLNVDDNKGKRSALAGLIRKAKRVFERTTNVKIGDGVKIAGFEIALK